MQDLLGGSAGGPMVEGYRGMENAKTVSTPSMKDRLEWAVAQAEKRLADAKRAREIFAKNPDLEELLNIMQRGHF